MFLTGSNFSWMLWTQDCSAYIRMFVLLCRLLVLVVGFRNWKSNRIWSRTKKNVRIIHAKVTKLTPDVRSTNDRKHEAPRADECVRPQVESCWHLRGWCQWLVVAMTMEIVIPIYKIIQAEVVRCIWTTCTYTKYFKNRGKNIYSEARASTHISARSVVEAATLEDLSATYPKTSCPLQHNNTF